MDNRSEFQFHKLINYLARRCEFTLDEEIIEIYDERLEPYGYDQVNYVIKEIIANRSPRDPFPSVKEIINQLEGSPSDKSLAVEVGSLIVSSIARRGYTWSWGVNTKQGLVFESRSENNGTSVFFDSFEEAVKHELGELAWHTIKKMGGWPTLVQQCMKSPMEVVRPQIRDVALSVIDSSRQGKLDDKPKLPQKQYLNDESEQVKKIVSKALRESNGN